MKRIDPSDLLDIAAMAHIQGVDLRTDLIYADAAHPLNSTFCEAIYHPDAKLWLHRDLAAVVLTAASTANTADYRFVVTDGLRTIDAQARMMETDIVRANPHWTVPGPDMLLSQPGGGGHPRAMAVDIYLETLAGQVVDMGTVLDYFSTNPADNPAARDYTFPADILANRAMLEGWMMDAARAHNTPLLPLPSEWWDFRLPPEIFNEYAPLADADLPPAMRMVQRLA